MVDVLLSKTTENDSLKVLILGALLRAQCQGLAYTASPGHRPVLDTDNLPKGHSSPADPGLCPTSAGHHNPYS